MKLSVIIPTRNRAELLVHAFESLFSQTLPQNDFELIVADNGSTDSTRRCAATTKTDLAISNIFMMLHPGCMSGGTGD
jgi:glycosyltransferase involved in cell wall biosynthesis